jgi:hypothetical protein
VRWHATKGLWLYLGMLDKVYGIRIVDHTAFSRAYTGLGMNDQSHSLIFQYIDPKWEFSLDAFAGNLYQEADLRQQGASVLFDYALSKDFRLGTSILSSTNKYVANQRFALHTRTGFTNGAALLFEVGTIVDTPKTETAKTGVYLYSEAIQKLARGYHLVFTGQAYKNDVKEGKTDTFRWSTGFLIFPLARFEYRMEFENTRSLTPDRVSGDTWNLYNQLHISL